LALPKTLGRRSACAVLAAALLLVPAARGLAVEAVPLSRYLDYARAAADWAWSHWDDTIETWKRSFDPRNVFGYRPPGGLLEMAAIESFLYQKNRSPELARRVKKVLLDYGDFRSQFPDWAREARSDYEAGVPPLPDFFTVMRYVRAYDGLKGAGVLTPTEKTKVESTIAESMGYLLRTQEWGPMNRAALRAESLAWACRVLPDNPRTPTWEMQRRALGDDNWGHWEIEDATIYHGVWLYALCGYADALGRRADLFRTPVMYYYARYFLQLMGPRGMIPDFGDATWNANWPLFLVYFETAAAEYRDAGLKWAAATIARRFVDFDHPTSVGLGYILLDAARWGTDSVRPEPPANLSAEVLEDVQGKKIVFRNGWTPESTYLLLNYRDEGDGGLYFRDYLRDTIPVEEEKMTHGHSDENAISLLMSGGSVLLHEAGYRDFMPSGPYGAYRQDYFHNRLCVRPEKIFPGQAAGQYRYSVREEVPGQGLLEFLRDAGSYRRVRTRKIDFLTFPDFDYSRTRVSDEPWGYESDRAIVYLKDPEMFVVFDVLKSLRDEYFTLAQVWNTRRVVSRGDHWFDTAYDRILDETLPGTTDLLIVFCGSGSRLEGVEPLRRHSQDEFLIHQTAARHFEPGQTETLIALLIPHPASESPASVLGRVQVALAETRPEAAGVKLRVGGRELTVALKTDLRRDMVREDRRPRYTYEAGRIRFGEFETNGDFVFGRVESSTLSYTVVNLTRALYDGRVLVEAPPSNFGLAFDGGPDGPGTGKLRYWRGRAPAAGRAQAPGRPECPR
jgi:hypothetical protein